MNYNMSAVLSYANNGPEWAAANEAVQIYLGARNKENFCRVRDAASIAANGVGPRFCDAWIEAAEEWAKAHSFKFRQPHSADGWDRYIMDLQWLGYVPAFCEWESDRRYRLDRQRTLNWLVDASISQRDAG